MNDMDLFRQISRADVLLGQSRFTQAEELLERLMSVGVENVEIFKMMAIAKMGLHKYEDASQLCTIIIEQNPNEAFAYYIMSNIKAYDRQFDEAKSLMDKAIYIDPSNADFFAFKANLFLQTKDFDLALESADTGLRADAENIASLNARSSALVGLGRKEEAFETIDKSLATDPNNPNTHANMGWGLLHHGRSDEALIHFKTALAEDPMHEYAKSGMLEAMKAKFPLYRYFLTLMLWLGKMKGKNQWIFIIGTYIGLRVLSNIAQNNEWLFPYLIPLIIIVVLFFVSTWIFSPIMNLYLLTNKFGSYTLSKEQKTSAKLVGLCLVFSGLSMLTYFLISQNEGLISTSILLFFLMIPLGSMYNPLIEANKRKLIYFSIAIVISVCLHGFFAILNNQFYTNFSIIPFGLLIGYQWYTNYIILRE
ncbi:MAG: tetratricopeptide repeat protein [Saprospiraceae bacterium]|nr:tetratricopeptide repeat protein [Saprospiraceae bacterium]